MSKKTRKESGKPLASRKARAPLSKTPAKQPTAKGGRSPSKSSKSRKGGQASLRLRSSKLSKAKAVATSNRENGARSVLREGEKAPSFKLPRDGGNTVSLQDFAGQKLVLFFYPRADTPGCTREAIDFTRLKGAFAAAGIAVVGVSGDTPKAQEAFRNKHQLSVPLASDETHEMLEAYGAWGEKSMYGRTFEGILRTTILIGADGRIVKIWRKVRVDGHADEVLAAARSG
ncbi:peroxiredoxin [Bradyrhizobium sp.]|uniref:peroxiredoxin n=1 Tax=Bradyrhizobium sp. TaxID=376 RepID=UPI002398A054|nr:peroxiredoxin [Bradyrhizobium sp.]MDE1935956.1 peroxiredoxin [Bradyrhizobium sp.]